MRMPIFRFSLLTLALALGCSQPASVVRDNADADEELLLQQVQQTVEAEEREHQQQILARRNGQSG